MKKKLILLAGIVVLIASCSYDTSRAYQYGGYQFKQIGKNSVSFCGFASDQAAQAAQAVSRTFVIPETIYGQPVTKIENEAFMSSTLFDQIVVPKTVTVIGRAAFYKCSASVSTSGNILTNEGQLPPAGENDNNYNNNNNSTNGNIGTTGQNGNNNGNGTIGGGGNTGGPTIPNPEYDQYAGSYSGTYTIAEFNGNWVGNVDRNGQMSIAFDGMQANTMLSPTGQFSVSTDTGLFIQGSISSSGRVSGTMNGMISSQYATGSFEGTRL